MQLPRYLRASETVFSLMDFKSGEEYSITFGLKHLLIRAKIPVVSNIASLNLVWTFSACTMGYALSISNDGILTLNIPSLAQRLSSWGPRRTPWFFFVISQLIR